MGIDKNTFGAWFGSPKLVSSSDVVQHDERSGRNLMVIARMPEEPFKTLNNLHFKAVYTCIN
eukprot:16431075-Heterocapsa_arctica.AAC.1